MDKCLKCVVRSTCVGGMTQEDKARRAIREFFSGFVEFNHDQARIISDVIMDDSVPGVTINVMVSP